MMYLFLLLAGCPEPKTDADVEDTAPADSGEGDTALGDTDETSPEETGLAQIFFVGDHQVADGVYVSGHAGYGFYGVAAADWICRLEGELTYEGPAPEGCPECDWAFDLSAPGAGVLDGAFCASLGVEPSLLASAGFDYSWGFASLYHYTYEDTLIPLEDTLFLYLPAEGWFPFSFNGGGRMWTEAGDAGSVSFTRPGFTEAGAYAYYYYYP